MDGSIEEALHLDDDLRWPASLLPIARVRVVTLDGGHAMTFLAIRLSGKRLGEIVNFSAADALATLESVRSTNVLDAFLEEQSKYAPSVARSLNDLFEKKLTRIIRGVEERWPRVAFKCL